MTHNKKIKLAIEIIDDIIENTDIDYDVHLYHYRHKLWKGKVLLGITFPDLLSKSHATRLANYIAKQINAYALPVRHTQSNTWYICFDIGSKT